MWIQNMAGPPISKQGYGGTHGHLHYIHPPVRKHTVDIAPGQPHKSLPSKDNIWQQPLTNPHGQAYLKLGGGTLSSVVVNSAAAPFSKHELMNYRFQTLFKQKIISIQAASTAHPKSQNHYKPFQTTKNHYKPFLYMERGLY